MANENKLRLFLIIFILFTIFIPSAVLGQRSEGLVTGKVLDAEGRAIKNIDVRVFAYRKGQWIEGFFIKNEGRYSIQLPKGEWFIGAGTDPESGFTGSDINLPIAVNGRTLIKNITLKRLAGMISGRVLKSDGSSLSKALVSLFGAPMFFSTETDLSGAYRFLVPSGKYLLRAFSSPDKGGINPKSEELILKEGQLANLSLIFKSPDRKIFGQVSLFNSPSGAFVWAWSDEGGYSDTQADNFGNYELKAKANEKWHVKAVKELDVYPYESRTYDVPAGKNNTELDIELNASVSKLPKRKIVKFSLKENDSVSVSLSNGMRLSLPPGAVQSDELTVSIIPFIGPNQKSIDVVGNAYRINLYDSKNQLIKKLKKSGVLEIPYSNRDLRKAGANENDLKVFFWDDDASAWRSNGNSVVVKKDKFILGLVDHFSEFVVADPEPPAPPSSSVSSSGGGGGGGGASAPKPAKPTPPSIVNASADQDSIIVSWFDFVLTKGEKYTIQRRKLSSDFADIAENIKDPPFVDTKNLEPGTTYIYRIIAVNGVGQSLPSPTASVRTPSDDKKPVVSDVVDISFTDKNEVKFTFTTNETARSSVNYGIDSVLESTLSNTNFLSVHSLAGPVKSNTSYKYQITATDEAGNKTEGPIRTFFSPLFSKPTPPSSPAGGQPPPPPPVGKPRGQSQIPAILRNYRFTRSLRLRSTGLDVLRMQQALNALGFIIAETGPGSPGKETTYFGLLSAKAIKEFQKAEIPDILASQGIPQGIDVFGKSTRAAMEKALKRN